MDVRVEGQVVDAPEQGDVAAVLQKALSGKKFKSVVAARVTAEGTETLCDLSATVPAQCTDITPVYADSPEGLSMIRHSTAHVMAAAVKKLYPSAKVTIGPAVENGFYYDFDVEKPFSSEDFPAIEAEMQRIVNERLPFVRTTMSKADAIEKFSKMGENFKVEIIEGIEGDTVSLYTCGDFTDLCRGPHVPHTGFSKASKILSAAGAYWRGDEKNPMLSRLYGTAFADEKALNAYLKQLEEAKRRDHRKLGRELGFFTFHEDVAPGMVFWLPKGMLMRTILEDFWRREHIKRNYDLVQGPQLLRVETWQRSGHYDHYRQNMYFTQIEDDQYGIKPMNCISHMLIYRNDLRSYRDLPQRYFELGVVHRHEKSGTLHGLLRVRQFTQDDAHILCTPEQLEGEILGVIHLIRDLMHLFGFDYKVGISTRPKDSIGTDEAWELATNALIEAVINGSLFGFLALQTLVMLNALLDLLADLLQRVQAGHRILHDHGDLLAADTQPILLSELGHIAAFKHDGAAGDLTVGIQHNHKGLGEYGLARAGLAHDGKGLAFVQVQRALADGVQLAAAQAESDLHVFGRDNRLSIHLRLSLQSIKRGCADQPHPTKRCP